MRQSLALETRLKENKIIERGLAREREGDREGEGEREGDII